MATDGAGGGTGALAAGAVGVKLMTIGFTRDVPLSAMSWLAG